MKNENLMLQSVLKNPVLIKEYNYNLNDYTTIDDALKAENPVVVVIARIIQNNSEKTGKVKRAEKELYDEVFNFLKNKIQ